MFVLTLLPVAELLTAIALLPDTVAVHWGLDGTPDRYSSRFELLIPVAIILLVGAVFWFKGKGEQPKGFRAGGMGAMLLFNVIVPICCMSPSTRRSTCCVFPLEKSSVDWSRWWYWWWGTTCRRSPGSTG